MIYSGVNAMALERIPQSAKRVLDIGCGSGALGQEIKKRISCEVVGITYSKEEAALASKVLDQVLVRDLEQFDVREAGRFDCVVCSHVLEHVSRPENLLRQIHESLTPGGRLVVVLPNILFWKQRWLFIQGHFKYTQDGLMDRTHIRFFDWQTAHGLLRGAEYVILESVADGMFPLPGFRRVFSGLGRKIDQAMGRSFPGLFGMQFVFTCESRDAGFPQDENRTTPTRRPLPA